MRTRIVATGLRVFEPEAIPGEEGFSAIAFSLSPHKVLPPY